MGETPDIESVETDEDYVHVRFRDPDQFDEIRTPDWAEEPAGSIAEGSEVRTGKEEDDDDWLVQSVLIPAAHDEDDARDEAKRIVEKIES